MAASYKNNVFINCPFDAKHDPMLKALVFTVLHCGFVPRCAKEQQDSAVTRIERIVRLIKSCKYGIHDISLTELDPKTKLPRFNMPLELGLFIGAKRYGRLPNTQKVCLVLDRKPYRYQIFISDIAGQDIRSHKDDIRTCIIVVRNWLLAHSKHKTIETGDHIWDKYMIYMKIFPKMCKAISQSPRLITYNDYVKLTEKWLKNN